MTKKLTIYVSGPMSNMPEHNFPAFMEAAEYLRGLGHTVINPAELNTIEEAKTWLECMKVDIRSMVDCDTIVTLPGWKKSKGASLEVHIGNEFGMTIVPFELFKKEVKAAV